MTYILYLITLFAFIVSLIAAVYYFQKYNKIRNRLPDIDGEEELMKPYNLLMQELEQKQQQLKQQSLQHHLLVKAIKLKLWKWDLKRKEIIWEGNLEKGEQGTVVVDVDEHLSHVLPEYRKRIYEAIDGLEKGCSKLIDEEFLYQNADNTLSWRNIYGIIYEYDEGGKPAILIGGTQIIDERKKLESDLRKAKDKAEEANRLKTAFLANMSHEIRTPLNAIIGFTRLVAETEDASEKDYYLNIVENNSELLTQLINDILDLSRIEAGSLEFVYKPVSIRELCLKIQEVHRVRMKEDVQLEFEDGGLNTHVLTDGNRLFQVISNLITNASKFTAKGFIRFGYQQVGDFIEFYVADSGCGIPKDKVPTIFDRFTKLNTFAQGSGLGLAICKMLVEKMGGNIFVQSEEGRGSIFKFTIPYQRITIETDMNDMENNEIKENVSVGRTILVAEDVESNFLLLKAIIGKTYTLLHAWNGKEAVEIYEQSHPDLILMDIKMPEMDGLEATRIIRKVSQEIPIIALTAFAFDDDRVKALEAGCNDYLTKPLSAPLLKETIAKYLV